MRHDTQGSGRSPLGIVALIAVMLATHVVLAHTTDLDGWPRSAIAIAVGVVVMILASMIAGKRKPSDSSPRG